jgi:hypothetical protein
VAAALDAAHARGLVHRDVKPANVLIALIDGSQHAYLTDFGLTKHTTSAGGLTKTGAVVGTIDFVAPEQIQGAALDARTDVYSLGCVLHTALTGQVPYVRDSDVAKMYAHLSEPPPAASNQVPGLPPELDDVIARAMAKDPKERYPSAGDLGRAAVAATERQSPAEPERSVARGEAAPATALAAPVAPTRQAPPPTRQLPPQQTPQQPAPSPQPAPPPPAYYTPAPTQALPTRRRGRGVAVGVAAALLGAALLAGGLFAAGVFDEEPRKPDGEATTIASGSGGSGGEGGGGEESKTVTSETVGYTPYTSDDYSAEYPADWSIGEDDVVKTTYSRTTFEAPDGSQVLIDHSPSQDAAPEVSAQKVEQETARTSGYQRLSFESTTLGDREAFEWTFQLGSERKIDIFLTAGGDGYAVLGTGADFDSVVEVTRHVAASIQPR